MNNDIFRSMKDQMVPSDDCVDDLLAKIAGLGAPGTATNTVQFEPAKKPVEVGKHATNGGKIKSKSIWKYGTAIAASVIVMVSAVSMFGTNPADVQTNLGNVISGPDSVAVSDSKEQNENGTVIDSTIDESESNDTPEVKDDVTLPEDETNKDTPVLNSDMDNQSKDSDSKGAATTKDTPKESKDDKSSSTTNNSKDTKGTSSGTKTDKDNSQSVDNKITPGETTSDIAWTKEILAAESVQQLTIQGTNYVVVGFTESSNSTVQCISLNLNETSETNAATVNATVKTVADASQDMVVAVDVDGFSETLLYTNPDYSPSTFGKFLKDSGLDKNSSFKSTVRITDDGIGVSKNTNKTVSDIESLMAQYIFVDDATIASTDAYKAGTTRLIVTSVKNSTGSKVYFTISDNGYVYVKTSIGYDFTFHIGSDNANAFIDAVNQN